MNASAWPFVVGGLLLAYLGSFWWGMFTAHPGSITLWSGVSSRAELSEAFHYEVTN